MSLSRNRLSAPWLPFVVFAATYFLAALLRAITATLAPSFSAEFDLGAADLGLLAGAYFLGFALLQLPLGAALDRWGPKRVELSLLALAVLGCALFALAVNFTQLVLARFAGSSAEGVSAIVAEVWARVEGVGAAMDELNETA